MPRTPTYTEDDVRFAVAHSHSHAEALRALGLRAAGGNHATLKRRIDEYGISTDHFDPYWSQRGRPGPRQLIPLEKVLVVGSTYQRTSLKQRLYAEGLKARVCELCGVGEEWNGGHMSLILDHINGEHDDNRLENLRIVCPNCNAGLETHCGRKNRNGPRLCLRCGAEFHPNRGAQAYCSAYCGTRNPGRRDPKPELRKVERPSHSDLLRELEERNYSAVGRKYGVSDNAVRKWLRVYEFQEEQRELDAERPAPPAAFAESDGSAHPE